MAAFINALVEEGTRKDVLIFVKRQREENGMIRPDDEFYSHWSKKDLIAELEWLWANRPRKKKHQS